MIKAQNKSGTWFKMVPRGEGYLVFKLCRNYNGRFRGGESLTWRCLSLSTKMGHTEFQKMAREGLPHDVALELYNRRLQGTQK